MGSDLLGTEIAEFLLDGRNNAGPMPDQLARVVHRDLKTAGNYAVSKNMRRFIRSGMEDARQKK